MRVIVGIVFLFFCTSFTNKFNAPYLIQKVQLKDSRLTSLLNDYIIENHLHDVEGVVLLKYDRDSLDNFYIGYMVRNHLSVKPPSHYTIIGNKLVMIYSGLEQYLSFNQDSFKMINKDCKQCFAEGLVIVEPTYWHIIMSSHNVEKRTIKEMPF